MASIVPRQRADGSTSYQVRWRENGRWDSRTFHEREHADEWVDILNRTGDSQQTERLLAERIQAGPTLRELMNLHIKSLTDVGPYMLKRYESYIRNYFSGVTGDLKAATVVHRDVVAWIRTMQQKDLSPKTIKNVHGFLSASFNTAVREGIRLDNPCKGVKLPKETSHIEKTTFLTQDEWRTLYNCLDPYYRPFYAFLVGTGLRFGEATALYAADFDLKSSPPTVRVSKAYKQDGDGGYYLGTPKTRKGIRTVSLAPSTVREILPLIEQAGKGHVFTTKTGMTLSHKNIENRAWRPAREKANLGRRVRVHDLRHTHASWMLQAGLDMYTLSARLGHSSIQMSIDLYSHIMPDAQFAGSQAAARALGEIA